VDADDRDDEGARGRLDAALNAVVEAFAMESGVGHIDGCARCFDDDELAILDGDTDLVPDSLVCRFAQKDTYHWEPEQYQQLWRRLAPRIIRLLVSPEPGTDPGLLLRGLGPARAGFSDWPASQRSAMINVLGAALDVALTDGRTPHDVLDLLGAASQVDEDVTPWTARIDTLTGPRADAGLVRLASYWALHLIHGYKPHWWWYPDEPIAIGTRWLSSPRVRERVGRFAAAYPLCRTAADAEAAIDALGHPGVWPWPYPTNGYDRTPNSRLGQFVHLIPGMEPP
jgi:hypothetical protein